MNIISKTHAYQHRIIGGAPTLIEVFPYLVNIAYKDHHKCGGSYLQTVWVLTAAHCLERTDRIKQTTCRMGMTYLKGDKTGRQVKRAIEFIQHPNYDNNQAINDVGLIKIDSPFKASNKIARIRLATTPYTDFTTPCVTSGWGLTIEGGDKFPDQLRYVELPILPQELCCKYYPKRIYVNQFMEGKIVCAGYKEGGFDACAGDSGGPLVCGDFQVGIVSWGIGCGSKLPGVYTNVSTYFSWIDGIASQRKFRGAIMSSNVTYHSKFYITILAILASCHFL